ncbi:esterase 1 [Mycena epipterygia]|nr:esterase 1 [Mycena epipterygia]
MLVHLSLLTFAGLVCVNGAPTVQLGNATLVGLAIPSFGQDFFGGIPFAEPPLGSLRLQPPVLLTSPAAGTFNATNFGLACLQTDLPLTEVSEDCLTINVFRPTGTLAGAKLPVIFSGGFSEGSAAFENASTIVRESVLRGTPVIYVNFNYRLGPLGFPQGLEANMKGALNLALKDQLTALEWVQLNIGTFGGDKEKVTVFGQSAGSIMTSILFLNSPLTTLARAAIFESGSQATLALFPAERGELDWQNFVRGVPYCASVATSGDTFSCLHGLIPDLPSVLFKRGQFTRLPFIAGTNLDEGTLFTNQAVNSTEEINVTLLNQSSPSISPTTLEQSVLTLLQLYPENPALGSPFGTGNTTFGLSPQFKRAAAIVGDLQFTSQRRIWIETASNAGVPTYGYLFTQPQPDSGEPALGVFHGSEGAFVYGTPSDPSASSAFLSLAMINYWVSFATSLTPNDGLGAPRPEWTQFTPENKAVIQLNGANLTMIPDDFRSEQMTFINSDPIIWRH